jgi:hypothetical protein
MVIRPSLTLNFQQSSPDQPMFDVLRRKNSASSSLQVHHSSPVPIPTPAKPEESRFIGGIPETVPTTPGPLRMAFERNSHCPSPISDSSPVYPRRGHDADPLPTPMPGTNLGFSENDLVGTWRRKQEASSSEHTSEPSSYFSIPVIGSSAHSDSSKADSLVDKSIHTYPGNNGTFTDTSSVANMFERDSFALHHPHTQRCICTATRYNHHHRSSCPVHNESARRTVLPRRRDNESESTASVTSSLNIDHVVYDDYAGRMSTEHYAAHNGYRSGLTRAQKGLQMQAPPVPVSNRASFVDTVACSISPQNTWGTSGSLYDGTGYGGTSGSTSGRPSTSSTAPEPCSGATGDALYTTASLAQESEATARDHETLDEVIRAYAALEESGISESDMEDAIAEARADVELANNMADHSLGA